MMQNPNLSSIGKERATNYLKYFNKVKFNAIYSTLFKRTKQTATPLAIKNDLEVSIYDPRDIKIDSFLIKHIKETVLIVGHSNTTPSLVNKFLGTMKYSQILHDNFSDVYKIEIFENGIKTDSLVKYD